MKFIIAFRLKRKNARRKIKLKIDTASEQIALDMFNHYCSQCTDLNKTEYELLTGDWKHITYYEGK